MLNLLVRWVLLAISLLIVAWIVPGISLGGLGTALVAAAVIGIINLFIRPLVVALTLPINILTLGLFTFVINALLLMLAAYIVPGFTVAGFLPALGGSLLLSALSVLINWTTHRMHAPTA